MTLKMIHNPSLDSPPVPTFSGDWLERDVSQDMTSHQLRGKVVGYGGLYSSHCTPVHNIFIYYRTLYNLLTTPAQHFTALQSWTVLLDDYLRDRADPECPFRQKLSPTVTSIGGGIDRRSGISLGLTLLQGWVFQAGSGDFPVNYWEWHLLHLTQLTSYLQHPPSIWIKYSL